MATSSEPFFGYLTIFRSRLGLGNLVLDATPLGHQSDRALRRRVRQVLERREELSLGDEANALVFQYLLDKKLVGVSERTGGRYRGLSMQTDDAGRWVAKSRETANLQRIPVFQTDIWMSNPFVPSTIGVPTPDNTEEVVNFAFQLRVLDRTKNSWTSAGHLAHGLRQLSSSSIPDPTNPFLLGAEVASLWRTLLERDGFLLRELVRSLSTLGDFRRDEVAATLPGLACEAVVAAERMGVNREALVAGRRLAKALESTAATSKSGAPGVLEHRTSPRLEWLTDLGYLTKEGFERNEFAYRTTRSLAGLVGILDKTMGSERDWPFVAAVRSWRANEFWSEMVADVAEPADAVAVGRAYEALRRPIGPAPLRDVAFVAALLCDSLHPDSVLDRVMEITRETPGASLSGGRTTRAPSSIYMNDAALRRLLEG